MTIKRFLHLSIIAACSLLLNSSLMAKDSAWELWQKGFSDFEKAEELNLSENKLDARDKFKKALEYFIQVQKKKPNWNKKVISYRIGLCKRKIARLAKEIEILEKTQIEPPTEPTLEQGSAADRARIANLKKELGKYKNKLFASAVELEGIKRDAEKYKRDKERNAKSSRLVEKLLREKSELEKKHSLQLLKIEELQKKANAPGAFGEDLKTKLFDEQMRHNKLKIAWEKLVQANKAQKQLEGEAKLSRTRMDFELKLTKEKLDELQAKLKNTELRLAGVGKNVSQAKTDVATLTKEKTEVRQAFLEKSEECEKLQIKLSNVMKNASPDGISKQLNEENGTLRKNLELLQAKYENIQKENRRLTKAFGAASAEKEKISSTLAVVEKERQSLANEQKIQAEDMEQKNIQIAELEKKNAQLENNLPKISGELNAFAMKYKKLQDQIDSKDSLTLKNFSFVKKNKELKAKLEELEKKLQDSEFAQKKLADTHSQLAQKHNELTENSKKKHEELSTKLAEKLKKIVETENSQKALQTQMDKLSKKHELLAKELEKAKNNTTLKQELANKEKAISELIDESKKRRQALKEQASTIADLKEKLNQELQANAENKKKLATQALPVKSQAKAEKETAPPRAADEKEKIKSDSVASLSNKKLGLDNKKIGKKPSRDTISFLMESGKNSESKNDQEAALWHYRKAVQLQPEEYEPHKRIGLILSKKGEIEKAAEALKKAHELKDDDIETLLQLGNIYITQGKNRSALALLNRAALLDKKNATVQRYLGVLCHNIGREGFAEKKFKKAIEFAPDSPEAPLELAKLLAKSFKGRQKEALKWYTKALENGAEPDAELDKLLNDGKKMPRPQKTNKPELSKETITAQKKNEKPVVKKTTETPKTAESTKTEAKEPERISDKAKAKLNNDTMSFLLETAKKAENKNDFKDAIWHCLKASEIQPNNPRPYKELGLLFLKQKNEYKAGIQLKKAHKLDEFDTGVTIPLGRILINQGKYKEALKLLNQAAAMEPKNPNALRMLGYICRNLNRKKQAETSLLKSFKHDPKSAETAMLLANLYTHTFKDRLKDGRKWYIKAKELGAKPDNTLEVFYRDK